MKYYALALLLLVLFSFSNLGEGSVKYYEVKMFVRLSDTFNLIILKNRNEKYKICFSNASSINIKNAIVEIKPGMALSLNLKRVNRRTAKMVISTLNDISRRGSVKFIIDDVTIKPTLRNIFKSECFIGSFVYTDCQLYPTPW